MSTESNTSSTANVAREMIAASEAANAPAPEMHGGDLATLMAESPWIMGEIEQNGNDDLSKPAENPTRRAAAIAVGAHDPRDFVRTREGFVRRDLEPFYRTTAIAHEIADSILGFRAKGDKT